jgi:ubiquinone/menaquinone biosynthesis C-methylase UbiE
MASLKKIVKSLTPLSCQKKYRRLLRAVKVKLSAKPSVDWSAHAELLDQWGKEAVWREAGKLLADCRGSVLDIGCGTGAAMQFLSGLPGLELHGCDLSPSLVNKCRERGIPEKRLQVCDLNGLGVYDSERFDYTYSIGVLHYVSESDLQEFAGELARITRKISFHFVPVSLSAKNEGWIADCWHAFQNNSAHWWVGVFQNGFASVQTRDSAWTNKPWSAGQWFVCLKSGEASKL